jgi:acyl carrier protein
MKDVVLSEVAAVVKDKSVEISAVTELIGDGRVLDSLGLVELCLRLEDRASELGFEFDWTSEVAMSQSRGMFRTVGSLQAEFSRQQEEPV